jgi:hypothetical protein
VLVGAIIVYILSISSYFYIFIVHATTLCAPELRSKGNLQDIVLRNNNLQRPKLFK